MAPSVRLIRPVELHHAGGRADDAGVVELERVVAGGVEPQIEVAGRRVVRLLNNLVVRPHQPEADERVVGRALIPAVLPCEVQRPYRRPGTLFPGAETV